MILHRPCLHPADRGSAQDTEIAKIYGHLNLRALCVSNERSDPRKAGCGECVDICPVNAVEMKNDIPIVDEAWCMGCGVCSTVCATEAIEMILRPDKTGQLPAATVSELHQEIMKEKGLK